MTVFTSNFFFVTDAFTCTGAEIFFALDVNLLSGTELVAELCLLTVLGAASFVITFALASDFDTVATVFAAEFLTTGFFTTGLDGLAICALVLTAGVGAAKAGFFFGTV
ncbi:MAG: hypothetical protein ABI351_12810 [Herbaspirillum sp.]